MPTTLSKGYKVSTNGERGWWQVIIDNTTRLNAHSHDGLDSEKITVSDLTKLDTTIAAADWVADSDGLYKKTVTLPTGVTFPNVAMKVYTTSGGNVVDEIVPTIVRVTNSTYDIYVNDNTLNLKVIYA